MAINDHAALAPSSAHIWASENGCRGSVALQAAYPSPEDSPEAREGTAAHHYVTEVLQGRDVPLGAVAPNGHPIDAEMVDAAQGILIDVRDTMNAPHMLGATMRVEQRVTMAHHVHESCWGTPDVVVIDRANRRLHVWDYKYGHRFVDAARNLQLMLYAIGVLEGEGCYANVPADDPRAWAGWHITITIAQPRNYHAIGPMREWFMRGETLAEILPQLRTAAFEAMMPDASFRTGDHCRDCSGRHACPALQRAGGIAMDVSLQAQPVDLPPHAVGLELRQIEQAEARLKARRTGLEEQALGLIRGGTLVPFYTAQHATGRERWKTPIPEVIALGTIFGVDLRKPQDAITPAQARKAGVDETVVAAYAETPKGALRLERVDDNAAKLAFE